MSQSADLAHTILLLDDEPNVLSALRRALRKEPYALLCAHSADEAFDLLYTREVDVVVSDQDMPGMTGTEFLAKVYQEFPHITRFILTGKATLEVALQAINAGAISQFFTKPCNAEALALSIRTALGQKDLAVALERARQRELEIKDRFLSHISHELRSPLTAIYQFVTILLDGLSGELNPEQREHLNIVLRNINQLRSMVSDLLDCARTDTGKLTVHPQWLSLTPVITDILNTLQPSAAERDIALCTHLPRELPAVFVDPMRIRQVLTNLIDNGIKFTPAQGTITLGTRELDDAADFLCLTVTDTGDGIAPEDTERIFERLSQTTETIDVHRQGLGLGLYICRELISRHQGRIWVESQPGHGSTFCFTLPRLVID
ncbi:MAG: ATP-binding protein [Candidatus Tectomicrobia bacterium]